MEKIEDKLQTLKTTMPTYCSHANLLKLQSAFFEYKALVQNLPETHLQIKNNYAHRLQLLEEKINIITDRSNSRKDSKYYFKEALYNFITEIDSIVESIIIRNK